MFWGEPLDGVRERIERLRALSEKLGREHAPLEFGLRVTTLVRDTTERAWADAEAKVAQMARLAQRASVERHANWRAAVGRQPYLPEIKRQGDQLLPLLA